MTHRWDSMGRCACGARMQVHGKFRRPERLYWNAAGEYAGTLAPECTRKPTVRRKPQQLALFGAGPVQGPAKPDGEES